MSEQKNEIKLKRVIGLYDGVLIILGNIIGSGIFITPTGVLSQLHSVSTTLIVWVVSGLISILGALCFSELAYLVPKTGAGYAYLQEAFGSKSKLGKIPAFLSCWLSTLAITPGTIAVIALTSSEYLTKSIFGECTLSRVTTVPISAVIIISCALINFYSVKWASRINSLFGLGKIAALVLITGFGVYFLVMGKRENLTPDFQVTETNPAKWATAFYLALYSYDGWYSLNTIVEEIKNPKKNLPLSILIALTLIIILYVMVNVSYLTLLNPNEMLSSTAVALTWAEKAFSSYSPIILVAVFVSNYGSCLVLFLCNTRITYAAARDSNLPKILSMIDLDHLTPSPSIFLTALISLLMILSSDIYALLEFFTFLIWIFYALNLLALLVLKKRKDKMKKNDPPNTLSIVDSTASSKLSRDEDGEKMSDFELELPYIFPIVMMLFSIGLVVMSLTSPNIGHLAALGFTFSGLLYYFPFVYYKKSFKLVDNILFYVQILMNVACESSNEDNTTLTSDVISEPDARF